MVRIRSEHAIGFLKGRFQSLKGLRVRIGDEVSHKFAAYWVAACINLHAFALQCEDDERNEDAGDVGPENDDFIAEGLLLDSSEEEDVERVNARHRQPAQRLRTSRATQTRISAAKAQREKIKADLFEAKRRRRERRQAALVG